MFLIQQIECHEPEQRALLLRLFVHWLEIIVVFLTPVNLQHLAAGKPPVAVSAPEATPRIMLGPVRIQTVRLDKAGPTLSTMKRFLA